MRADDLRRILAEEEFISSRDGQTICAAARELLSAVEADAICADGLRWFGYPDSVAEWGEATRQKLLPRMRGLTPDIMRLLDRPIWAALYRIDSAIDRELHMGPLPDTWPIPDMAPLPTSVDAFEDSLRNVAAAAVQATLEAILAAGREDAAAGAENDHNADKARGAAERRAAIVARWRQLAHLEDKVRFAVMKKDGYPRSTVRDALKAEEDDEKARGVLRSLLPPAR